MGDPGPDGRFGTFGGRFVPESLVPACFELEAAFEEAWSDRAFRDEFDGILREYGGRPTPVTECGRLSEELGIRLLLKREDLTHTGSHKLNNVIGQSLLTRRMGKSRLIAETGAGQHGVASATAAALFGMECVVYMGDVDMKRQELNVFRMELLGAEVRPVSSGSRTLKDAVNEALRDWVATVEDSHYCVGSVVGPHPFPWMVRQFQRIIGDEARAQCRELLGGADPDLVVACAGGGSNAAGIFAGFADASAAELVAVEAAGGAALTTGISGILHGMRSALMQDEAGQILEATSISAGLDYPGIGPEHAHLDAIGRARYETAGDGGGPRGVPASRADRGPAPRARVGPCARVGARRRRTGRDPIGRDRAGQPLRPRGQGRRPGPGHPARRVVTAVDEAAPGRLESVLRARRDAGHKLLVPYVTGGLDDDWLLTLEAVAGAGADAIEVGIPFSDPMIDGPTIQEASFRALERGTTPEGVLADLSRVDVGIPLVVMTYYNLIFRAGHARIAGQMVESGVSGAIIPDLPLEEVGGWAEAADRSGVATVLLVAPSTPEERIGRICERSRGFVYAVGRMGVTGERSEVAASALRGRRPRPGRHRSPGLRRDRGVDARPGGGGLRGRGRGGGRLGPGATAARGRGARRGGRVRRLAPPRARPGLIALRARRPRTIW